MPSWILGPVDHRSEVWTTYPVQRVVVEAADEQGARQQVAGGIPAAARPNPWLDPDLTSCDQISPPEALARPSRGAWAAGASLGAAERL